MITDEMIEKARGVMRYDYPSCADMRAALEAVAPLLIAQGMREAVTKFGKMPDRDWPQMIDPKDLLDLADALDPPVKP